MPAGARRPFILRGNSGILFRIYELNRGDAMAFYAFYVIAIIILILHFTGWLKRNNLEWLILALAVAVFPVVIFFR
jgi:hypothetical protein